MKKWKSADKWLNRGVLGIVALLLVSGYAQAYTQKFTLVFDSPDEVSWIKPTILGDEDEVEREQEDEHEDEQKQEEQNKEEENKREEEKQQAEERKETEIETQDGQKIKTKIEDDGTTKVEIEQDDLKIKYEVINGEINSIEEDDDQPGDELETDDDEMEISTEQDQHKVRLNGVTARTNFPLSIDVATNELIVATKDGPKIVAILPDQAVDNLLETGIVDRVDSGVDLELQVQNGEPVYQIAGTKRYRFLAFIPVIQPVVAVVSAETGEVVATQQSVLANIVDFLSP